MGMAGVVGKVREIGAVIFREEGGIEEEGFLREDEKR